MPDDDSTPPGEDARAIRREVARRQQLQEQELGVVRARASNWGKGLAALMAGVLAFGLIKGRSDISELPLLPAVTIGALLVLVCICVLVAATQIFRAAFGSLKPSKLTRTDHEEAESSMSALRRGLIAAFGGFALLVVAVGITWYWPAPPPPALQVIEVNGQVHCARSLRIAGTQAILSTPDGDIAVRVSSIQFVDPASDCGPTP